MRAGHNLEPNRIREQLLEREVVRIFPHCWESVRRLREEHGIPDATPYTYFTDTGSDLNIYSEPPEFLPPPERAKFEPLEFFGSYWPGGAAAGVEGPDPFGPAVTGQRRIFISFGTVAWMRDAGRIMDMLDMLDIIADALAALPHVWAIISLGNRRAAAGDLDRLCRANVRVEPYVDQIQVLRHADIFITHHGLNSTHEAIFHGVPMISYPLYHDQPGLSALCQRLGVAVPLEGSPLTVADVHRALRRVEADGPSLRARLAEARDWELAIIRQRPAVLDRVLALMDRGA